MHTLDAEALVRDVDALRVTLTAGAGEADLRHLSRVRWMGRAATAIGLLTAWIAPNPLSAFALGFGRTVQLTVGHHVLHKAYDRVPGVPEALTSRRFGRGWRRFVDWFDWGRTDAWTYTHNRHHAHTNTADDPDLCAYTWVARFPGWLRPLVLVAAMCTFKAVYYVPRMQFEHANHQRGLRGLPPLDLRMWKLHLPEVRDVWLGCLAPYALVQFALLPLLFLPLGAWAAFSVLCNSLLGEAVTNIQTFVCVGTTHVAEDVPRFEERARGRGEYLLRAITGAVDYQGGGDFWDAMHIWCNHQVAHHLWADLTLLQYQRSRPHVEALCARHGLRYRRQGVWARFARATDLYLARAEHPRVANASAWLAAGGAP